MVEEEKIAGKSANDLKVHVGNRILNLPPNKPHAYHRPGDDNNNSGLLRTDKRPSLDKKESEEKEEKNGAED